jgi:hypothetical protein
MPFGYLEELVGSRDPIWVLYACTVSSSVSLTLPSPKKLKETEGKIIDPDDASHQGERRGKQLKRENEALWKLTKICFHGSHDTDDFQGVLDNFE